MKIEIKKSLKPVNYEKAISLLEKKMHNVDKNNSNEFLWILKHPEVYTAGTSYKSNEVIDKSIKIIKTSRGGKITWHGPGQLICYFVIDLKKRKKDIRYMIKIIEKIIIQTLESYNIKSFGDKKNIGIWVKDKNKFKKIAAIGIKIKKWIAFHGFSINIDNKLEPYNKILPCGMNKDKVTTLKRYKNKNYKDIDKILIKNFIKNFQI